jgi:hypothetical protein
LIEEINKRSSSKTAVAAFGWYDAAQQKLVGLTAIPTGVYGPDGKFTTNAGIFATAGNPTLDVILNNTYLTNMSQPYQVTVREALGITLEGTVKTSD